MPTEKIRERLPKSRSMEARLMDNVLEADKHLQMGPIAASPGTPRFNPEQPAGRKADLGADPVTPRAPAAVRPSP